MKASFHQGLFFVRMFFVERSFSPRADGSLLLASGWNAGLRASLDVNAPLLDVNVPLFWADRKSVV